MARLPMVPGDWLAGNQELGMEEIPLARDQEAEMKPLPLARDDAPTISDMLYRYPQPPRGTSLSMLMEPEEIASIPGLPDHVYEGLGDYADQRERQDAQAAGSPRLMAADASLSRPDEGQPAGSMAHSSDLDFWCGAIDRAIKFEP